MSGGERKDSRKMPFLLPLKLRLVISPQGHQNLFYLEVLRQLPADKRISKNTNLRRFVIHSKRKRNLG